MENCKHNFVAEKYKTQEVQNEYMGKGVSQNVILDKEHIKIFCTKCGETKHEED